MQAWLKCLPSHIEIKVLTIESDDNILLMSLLGLSQKKNPYLPGFKEGFVNETGILEFDDVVIECNGFLSAATQAAETINISALLKKLSLNKLSLNNVHYDDLSKFLNYAELGNARKLVTRRPSYYVSLEKVRASSKGYLSLLSVNKRSQIKRAIKLFEERSEIVIQKAGDTTEALSFFKQMITLHQKEWGARGKEGAFSNNFILSVHTRLIEDSFQSDLIRIFKIYNQNGTIGIIYGFISGKDFLYYQSGFNYSDDNRIKPGLVCHTLLINYFAAEGLDSYDFLAGDAPYKKSLSTDSYEMLNVEFYDDSLKSYLYTFAKEMKRIIREKLS